MRVKMKGQESRRAFRLWFATACLVGGALVGGAFATLIFQFDKLNDLALWMRS